MIPRQASEPTRARCQAWVQPTFNSSTARTLAAQSGGELVSQGVPDGAYFYFVHSFYAIPSDARHIAGQTEYGSRFTSAVCRDNIFATQFHPEKSADLGLALYRNFLSWNP